MTVVEDEPSIGPGTEGVVAGSALVLSMATCERANDAGIAGEGAARRDGEDARRRMIVQHAEGFLQPCVYNQCVLMMPQNDYKKYRRRVQHATAPREVNISTNMLGDARGVDAILHEVRSL